MRSDTSASLPTLHAYMHYHVDGRKILLELVSAEEVNNQTFSVFVGRGYLQQERCGWRGQHTPGNRTSLISARYGLNDGYPFCVMQTSLREENLPQT